MISEYSSSFANRNVFVTGATGFIGRRIVVKLLDFGANVTVLVRNRRSKDTFPNGVHFVFGDLNDGQLLATNLGNQDILFHLAYDVRAAASDNIAAFDALLTAATNANIGRIVHTSSIVVYDEWPDQDIAETGSMQRPGGSAYRQAKIEIERRLMNAAIPVAIIQPTIVYGPGSALWTDQLAESLISGGIVLPTPEGYCQGVFVDDLVQGMLRAAVVDNLERERFIISGPAPFLWSDLFQGYAEIIGKGSVEHVALGDLKDRLGPAPVHDDTEDDKPSLMAQISAVGRTVLGRDRFEALVRFAKRRLAKGGMTYPDHHLLELYASTGNCSIELARKRLGYVPEFDLGKGLSATASHLKSLNRG